MDESVRLLVLLLQTTGVAGREDEREREESSIHADIFVSLK